MHTLAGKRVTSIQQTGSMAHVLMDRGLARDYANSVADGFGGNGIRFWSRRQT